MAPIYNVGDEVLLKVKITTVDPNDQRLTYEANNGFWFAEHDIFALIPKSGPVLPEPITVGDFAKIPGGDIGQVVRIGSHAFILLMRNGDTTVCSIAATAIRADKPADWPF